MPREITIYKERINTVDAGLVRVTFYEITENGQHRVTCPMQAITERGRPEDEWCLPREATIEADARRYGVVSARVVEGEKPGRYKWNRGFCAQRLDGGYEEPKWRRVSTWHF